MTRLGGKLVAPTPSSVISLSAEQLSQIPMDRQNEEFYKVQQHLVNAVRLGCS